MANFGQILAQNGKFSIFPGKIKMSIFTLPKTNIHVKNQGNPMCGFLEKRLRDGETRLNLMVQIRLVSVGPKIRIF